jgi:hypothetical protein
VAMGLLLAGFAAAQETAPAPPAATNAAPLAGGEITGTVKAGNTPLPGVAVSATNTLTGQKVITSSELGSFALKVPANGRWVVRAEMSAFAPATQEALINAGNRSAKVELGMRWRTLPEPRSHRRRRRGRRHGRRGRAGRWR